MCATLHDFGMRGIVVTDGKRTVAKAKYYQARRVWLLRIYDASWADTLRNEEQAARYAKLGLRRDIAPHLKTVKTRREALRILTDISRS